MISAANLSALNAIPYVLVLIILGLILIVYFWKGDSDCTEQSENKNKYGKNILLIGLCLGFLFCAIQIMRIMN